MEDERGRVTDLDTFRKRKARSSVEFGDIFGPEMSRALGNMPMITGAVPYSAPSMAEQFSNGELKTFYRSLRRLAGPSPLCDAIRAEAKKRGLVLL